MDPDETSSERVFVVDGERIGLAEEALAALAADDDAGVYVRGRQLVRVIRDRAPPD